MTGPRMFVCGYGMHVASRPGAPTPSRGQANGVDEVVRAVREQIAAGADGLRCSVLPGARRTYPAIKPVEGNPFADINVVIHNVRWVMKGGAVVVDKTTARRKR